MTQPRIVHLPDGRRVIVYEQEQHYPIPQVYQPPQQVYQPPQYYPQQDLMHPQYQAPAEYRPARRRRKKQKQTVAGQAVMLFVLSWIPTAFGHPGITLLIWGLSAAYFVNEAAKRTGER